MVRLGQNFLADTNLLGAIVREAEVGPTTWFWRSAGGGGAHWRGWRRWLATVHVIELDRRLEPELEAIAAEHGNVGFISRMRCAPTSAALDPTPTRMVANLPYSIATPLIIRTITDARRHRVVDADGAARDRRSAAGAAVDRAPTARRA